MAVSLFELTYRPLLAGASVVGGDFIHGKDVEISAGTEIYIQIKDQVNLHGI